jgi:hypothetical protein
LSVTSLPAPVVPDQDDDDLTHLFCCNPDRSLCGLDCADWEYLGPVELTTGTCAMCVLEWQDGQPCGADCQRGAW